MRILVIGGTGFIGRFLLQRLMRERHQIAVFHRGRHSSEPPSGIEQIVGDRNHLSECHHAFERLVPDIVIDMILSSGRQAKELMATFAGLTGRVVALSSMDVYRACAVMHGLEPGPIEPVPLTEDSPLRTKGQTYPPAQIKMLQQIFGWLDDEYDKIPVEREVLGHPTLPGTVLRLPMVYGPGDPLNRLLPVLKRIDDGRRTILFSESMAKWRGPRGYVENVAAAVALAATSARAAGRIYNVAEPQTITELDWARKIASVAGWDGKFMVVPDECAPAHLRPPGNAEQHWVADSTRIRQELEYHEPIEQDVAISRTLEWMRANPARNTSPHVFDYAAEDATITSTVHK